MNWNKIVTVMIVLLLLVNVYLGYNIYTQYVDTYIISDSEIASIATLMEKNGITIDTSIIPNKRIDGEVIVGEYDTEEYYRNAALALTEAVSRDEYNIYMTDTGVRLAVKDSAESLMFYDSDLFRITYSAISGADSEYAVVKKIADSYEGSSEGYSEKNIEEAEDALNSFIKKSDKKSLFGCSVVSLLENQGYNVCEWNQTADGKSVYSMNGVAVFDGNMNVVYLDGKMIVPSSLERMKAQVCDQINVLFMENAQAVKDSEENKDESAIISNRTVVEMEYCLCINWNSSFDSYYLVPAWKIVYDNGEERIWNVLYQNLHTM